MKVWRSDNWNNPYQGTGEPEVVYEEGANDMFKDLKAEINLRLIQFEWDYMTALEFMKWLKEFLGEK